MFTYHPGKVCGDCIHCVCRDIITGNPLIPSFLEVYCNSSKPMTCSGLVNPKLDYAVYCDYFKQRSTQR